MKTKTSLTGNSVNRSPVRLAFATHSTRARLLALSPTARAACEEGCDLGNGNTFLGDEALSSNTTGSSNTATGSHALSDNTTGTLQHGHGF